MAIAFTAERAASAEAPSVAPISTVPSSSMVMSAPVSSWIWLIMAPLGPMTAPILSTGMRTEMIRGAVGAISSGASMAAFSTDRMCRRASRACVRAAASTEAGMPSSLVSSWIAVTNSAVPATLKSMSPNASSAPRMSVRAAYWVWPSTSAETRPMAMPATCARSGTPAFSRDRVEAQTEPIDVEPLEPRASETWRIA